MGWLPAYFNTVIMHVNTSREYIRYSWQSPCWDMAPKIKLKLYICTHRNAVSTHISTCFIHPCHVNGGPSGWCLPYWCLTWIQPYGISVPVCAGWQSCYSFSKTEGRQSGTVKTHHWKTKQCKKEKNLVTVIWMLEGLDEPAYSTLIV